MQEGVSLNLCLGENQPRGARGEGDTDKVRKPRATGRWLGSPRLISVLSGHLSTPWSSLSHSFFHGAEGPQGWELGLC